MGPVSVPPDWETGGFGTSHDDLRITVHSIDAHELAFPASLCVYRAPISKNDPTAHQCWQLSEGNQYKIDFNNVAGGPAVLYVFEFFGAPNNSAADLAGDVTVTFERMQ